jgi:ADP-heptose:LPS heptosyltransferase
LRYKKIGKRTPVETWKKCLITSEHHLGDVLYRTASLDILKKGLPNCSLYYLCSAESMPLLENNPNIEKALPFIENVKGLKIKKHFKRQLREMSFDAVIITDIYKYYRPLLFAIKLRIPNRVCFTYKGFTEWITHPVDVEVHQPFPYYIRQLFSRFTNINTDEALCPKVYLSNTYNERLSLFYKKHFINERDRNVAIFMGGRTLENFISPKIIAELIKLIKEYNPNINIFVLGAKNDNNNIQLLEKYTTQKINYSFGDLNIQELLSFLKKCSIIFTPDSGPRHLANSVKTPVVYYRRLMAAKIMTGTYCRNERDIFENYGDEHLSKKGCQKLYDSISPHTIFDLMKQYL